MFSIEDAQTWSKDALFSSKQNMNYGGTGCLFALYLKHYLPYKDSSVFCFSQLTLDCAKNCDQLGSQPGFNSFRNKRSSKNEQV